MNICSLSFPKGLNLLLNKITCFKQSKDYVIRDSSLTVHIINMIHARFEGIPVLYTARVLTYSTQDETWR